MSQAFSSTVLLRGVGALLALVLLAGLGCRSAPITGRKQMLLLPEDKEVALGATAYQETVAKEQLSTNAQYNEMVQRVGQRIAAVSDRKDYQWEFKVIASPQQNAFCLPGGKVAVHEGILPICESEAGLAVVMSHEIAHALARHGGERISQGYAVEAAKQAMSYVTQTQDQQRQEMIMKAYGAASQYGVILPYSRKHESEADHIGLMLMSKAGYDPAEAPRFWQRFGAANAGQQPMEFFSTHPSDANRAANLMGLLPEAQQLYALAPEKLGRGEMLAIAPSTPAAAPATTLPGAPPPPSSLASPGLSSGPGAASPSVAPPTVIPTGSSPSIFGPPIRGTP
ncbi:MAG: M48 family metallopeptidase [Pirellulales bacterium]|jgi:predicted Zn-dependent protease